MKWLNQTRRGKAVLAVVFTLACFVSAMCFAGIVGAQRYECYDPDVESYYDTADYYNTMEMHANAIISSYAYDRLQSESVIYEAGNTNLRFRITPVYADGTLGISVAHNSDDTKTQFGAWYLFMVYDGTYNAQVMSRTMGQTMDLSVSGPLQPNQTELQDLRANVRSQLLAKAAANPIKPDYELGFDGEPAVYQLELRVIDPITVDASYSGGLKHEYVTFNYLYGLRYWVIGLLAVCGLAALLSLIALFAGTGRLKGQEDIVFGWFDRIPMELSFLGLVALGTVSAVLVWEFVPDFFDDLFYWVELPEPAQLTFAISGLALVFTQWAGSAAAWLLAFVRAAKSGHAFRGFITVRALNRLLAALNWLVEAVAMLPLVPKVALGAAGFVGANVLLLGAALSSSYIRIDGARFVFLILPLALIWLATLGYVIYGAVSMKKLDDCARMIAKGNYQVRVNTFRMPRYLRSHAQTLENIAAGLNDAVAERTKSERMKTELITNVSHDLKTPLTSIINYTDLLQSQPLTEKAAEYAAVLARESARLKKLTEDLVEASKASSGAMPCEKQPTDLAELCEQALGEYGTRLEHSGLTPVLAMPPEGLWANVDGRLVWRTLDNLLGNACKYALPGTRLYLTGRAEGDRAVLEMKNISREPLNISADELMARFVRGDSSRSTEGSGLGLSIAQSLCELQGGSFGLKVDGDLFKAELNFAWCAAAVTSAAENTAAPEPLTAAQDPTNQ